MVLPVVVMMMMPGGTDAYLEADLASASPLPAVIFYISGRTSSLLHQMLGDIRKAQYKEEQAAQFAGLRPAERAYPTIGCY